MEQLSFKLEVFEGPLDLLLKLISKNKINIFDIPISDLLTQYMEAIDEMKSVDMDIASEFISMASYLLYIKSKTLLPQHDEEEEDPREMLVRMLLEYQRYKEVVLKLSDLYANAPVTAVRKPLEIESEEEAYSKQHSLDELSNAYGFVLKKARHRLPPPVKAFKGIVGTTWTTISTRVVSILRNLLHKKTIKMDEAYSNAGSRSDIVATFLALLELMHNKRITVNDSGDTITLNDGKVSSNENTGN